jgi:nascent polypeptide-associated complex subunit beta
MSEADNIAAARAKMIAKRFGGASTTSTGGKGSVRRKKKISTRSGSAQSDAKLTTTLKKLGATNIPGIEEVNFFKEDGKIIHFKNPKVQASVAANTYIISGPNEIKTIQDLLPGIMSQLGMNDMSALQGMAGAGGMQGNSIPEGDEEDDDDDDVPDLVDGNFEEASEK